MTIPTFPPEHRAKLDEMRDKLKARSPYAGTVEQMIAYIVEVQGYITEVTTLTSGALSVVERLIFDDNEATRAEAAEVMVQLGEFLNPPAPDPVPVIVPAIMVPAIVPAIAPAIVVAPPVEPPPLPRVPGSLEATPAPPRLTYAKKLDDTDW